MNAENGETGIHRYIPILAWLPQYQRKWLRPDFVAGLTIMALLVPEGMAYAQLAGMPPQAAFYAAPIGLTLYAIFGTSRQLVVAVSSAVAVMSASIVGGLVPAGSTEFIAMTAALAILAGIVAVMAGLLRLGRIAQFFSESVLMGFVSGLALVIMIKQVPKLFGLEAVEGNFWDRVIESGGAILVHCKSGVHRSVAQAACVLIGKGYTADDAMQLIKDKRAVADPDARHIQSRIRKFAMQWPPQ